MGFTGKQFQRDVRSWLSPPDPSTNHNIAREDHLDGTSSWFIQGGTFNDWKEKGSLLWIYGKRIKPLFTYLPFCVLITARHMVLQQDRERVFSGK